MVETVSRQGLSQGVFPCCMCPWEPHLTGTHWICYGHMGATGSHWHRLGTGSHGLSLSLGPHGVMAPMGSHGVPMGTYSGIPWELPMDRLAQKDFGRIGQARLGKGSTWSRRGELVGLF